MLMSRMDCVSCWMHKEFNKIKIDTLILKQHIFKLLLKMANELMKTNQNCRNLEITIPKFSDPGN